MKKYFLSFAVLAVASAQAAPSVADVAQLVNRVAMADVVQSAQNVINWQVGDYHKLTLAMAFGSGTATKEATSEDKEQNAVWLATDISILGQMQKTEALISRTDGKVLKLLVNGKEQAIEDEEIEILEQAETTVTVPAGTFDCLYVRANVTAQGQKQEVKIWANPIDVNLDGSLKMIMGSQIGDITLTLNEFGHH